MQWNDRKSILLSQISVYLFAAIALGITCTGPWFVDWFIAFSRADLAPHRNLLLAALYTTALPAFAVLWQLHGLLRFIRRGQVFVARNVARLRAISWLCILIGLICCAASLFYVMFIIVAALAAFMGLLVRVIKNVFEQAVLLQTEVDYTI